MVDRASKGHIQLLELVNKLLPNEPVLAEYHVGERLFLDIYIPGYKLGLEYHGMQHFNYVEFFHGNLQGFLDSQARDTRKAELCVEQGIALAVFMYYDELCEAVVFERLMDAIKHSEYKEPVPDPQTIRRRKYNREAYQKLKKRDRGRTS